LKWNSFSFLSAGGQTDSDWKRKYLEKLNSERQLHHNIKAIQTLDLSNLSPGVTTFGKVKQQYRTSIGGVLSGRDKR